jgi:hypothetical protein
MHMVSPEFTESQWPAVGLIRRIVLLPLGLIAIVLAVLSLIVAVALMFMGFSQIGDPESRFVLMVFTFFFVEIFLAFGVAAGLVGLRCMLGPRKWILRAVECAWKRAVSFTLIWGYVLIALGVIHLLLRMVS